MARAAYISSPPSFPAVNVSAKTQAVGVTCEWDYNAADDHIRIGFQVETNNPPTGGTTHWYDTISGKAPGYWRDSYDYSGGGPETMTCDGGTTSNLLRRSPLNCDTTYYARSVIDYWLDYSETTKTQRLSSIISFKTYPIPFVCATPVVSAETTDGATVDFTYYPNTVESVASVSLQYKKASESIWTSYVAYSGQSGYTGIPKTVVMTGLEPDTLYNVSVNATRNTSSSTTFLSSTASFTTLPAVPLFETRAATTVGDNAATLNARVWDDLLPVDITWEWDVNTGAPYANETSPAQTVSTVTGDGYRDVSTTISGLTDSTTYYFRAKAVYNGGSETAYEDELTLTTTGIPGAKSEEEEHMQTIQFDGQYGVAKTVTFTLRAPSADNSNLFYTSTAPVNTTDVKVYQDGVLDDFSDNAVSGTHAPVYSLQLSAAEMQAETVDVWIHDADATLFRDAHIQVRTAQRLSELDIDATSGPTNASAITAVGNGTGHGIYAAGGATGNDIDAIIASLFLRVAVVGAASSSISQELDANADGNDDFYKGCIITVLSGTGAGQARVITAYNGTSKVATLDSAFTTNTDSNSVYAIVPGSRPWEIAVADELQALPSLTTPKYGEMLQLLFQRFAFKVTQDGTTQTWYDTADQVLTSRTVGDTGTEQTVGALS